MKKNIFHDLQKEIPQVEYVEQLWLNYKKSIFLESKTALANKRSSSDAKKAKIERCLCLVYMSSEDEEEDGTFSVRRLPWRSQIFDTIMEELDAKTKNTATKNISL